MLDHHLRKPLPPLQAPHLEEVGSRGWNALDGDLLFPVLVLKDRALRHNVEVMRRFCHEHDVSLAPHGKTTMSPELIRRQLTAGAWGISAATPGQAGAMRAFGARRVLIANQVPDPLGLRWMAAEMAANPDVEIYSLVDSVPVVRLMDGALSRASAGVQLPVLVEMGVAGGRTGCRSREQAHQVAAAVRDTRGLRLAGVAGFEGVIGYDSAPSTLARVDGLLGEIRTLTGEMAARGAFAGAPEIVVSAGGSTYFDRVVEVLAGGWELRRPVRAVRSGGGWRAGRDCSRRSSCGGWCTHGRSRIWPSWGSASAMPPMTLGSRCRSRCAAAGPRAPRRRIWRSSS
jgi:D-serine dehydratase